jgi:hypothetical protein
MDLNLLVPCFTYRDNQDVKWDETLDKVTGSHHAEGLVDP